MVNGMRSWRRGLSEQALATVVMAVYNKPRELKLCLEAYRRQSILNSSPQGFELLLADDGSSPEIEEIFAEFSRSVSFPTLYLRQDDNGWGKLRMLNWSVIESFCPIIIFTDGDCLPHRNFVSAHLRHLEEGFVSCGRRVDMMESLASKFCVVDLKAGKLESWQWILRHILDGGAEFGEQGLYLPAHLVRALTFFSKNKTPTLVGSNFSLHKKWLYELNGFDETFRTPGLGEDTDIERRMKKIGLKMKWVTYRAIQFHLWHPLQVVGETSHRTYEELKIKDNDKALIGLNELQAIL